MNNPRARRVSSHVKANPKSLLLALAACVGVALISSCTYDPYAYSGYGSGTATYSVSYGSDHGYGYDPYDVAVPAAIGLTLIATSSPYWGYDPYRYAYYDYRQQCYYDPWLDSYYPHGYRPRPVYGVPHPYGWRPGHGVCPYPRHPYRRWVNNHYDRLQGLKASHYAWAQKVRYNRQSWAEHMRHYPEAWQHRLQAQHRNGPVSNRWQPRPNHPGPATGPKPGHGGGYGNRGGNGHYGQANRGGRQNVLPHQNRRPLRAQTPQFRTRENHGDTRHPANRQKHDTRKRFGSWFNTPVIAPMPATRPVSTTTSKHVRAPQRNHTGGYRAALARQKEKHQALRQRIQQHRRQPQ
jgi:hypothetical protein